VRKTVAFRAAPIDVQSHPGAAKNCGEQISAGGVIGASIDKNESTDSPR
jgi:hypothetical protein